MTLKTVHFEKTYRERLSMIMHFALNFHELTKPSQVHLPLLENLYTLSSKYFHKLESAKCFSSVGILKCFKR